MPSIMMSKLGSKLDPALKKKAFTFLEKLTEDDTTPGLHIEPIHGSADSKVRTGRVDDNFRAVLFKMTSPQGTTYVFHGIWPHDDAITVAKKTVLTLNPVNGIAEVRTAEPSEIVTPAPAVTTPSLTKPEVTEPPVVALEPVAEVTPGPLAGHDVAVLVGELGLDAELARAAVAAPDDDAVLELAGNAVEWQGLAVVDLAAGHTVAEVKDKLSIGVVAPAEETSEDEAILRGLRHPAAQMSFTYIENNEELRRVIEGGDFGAWRVFLHPVQRQYAEKDFGGPFRLSGGAGTGKTVVLLHRARTLARRDPQARVLATTFTTNLAEAMSRDLERLDPGLVRANRLGGVGVHVTGIDSLALAVVRDAGTAIEQDARTVLGVGMTRLTGRTPVEVWRDAIDEYGAGLPEPLRSPAFFATEYSLVVLPNLITVREAYFRVRRTGRGVALDRGKRSAVWDVIEAYRSKARMDETVDFHEVATISAVHLQRVAAETGRYLADHVLVDEGQDLTPAHWQLLRALVGEHPNDLFIAEDSHQRIYGQKVTLSQYGIKVVGRSRRLTLNYRTTAQNLNYAMTVLSGGEYVDLEDGAEEHGDYRSARSGPAPRLLPSGSLGEELDVAAEVVGAWVEEAEAPETVAVLVRDKRQAERVVTGLAERGVEVRAVDREKVTPGHAVVMTMHRAKGTEFAKVLLFGLSEGSVPAAFRDEQYDQTAAADALLRERSLVYVAATRARDELAISWSGRRSEILGD